MPTAISRTIPLLDPVLCPEWFSNSLYFTGFGSIL